MSYDYEHRDLEDKIAQLRREVDDLRYEINWLRDNKADKEHYHRQYASKEQND